MEKNDMLLNNHWLMVIGLLFIISYLSVSEAVAQPKARRVQQQQQTEQQSQKKKSSPSSAMTRRAQISFPTAVDMPEDVVWRRDIYREINLAVDVATPNHFLRHIEGRGERDLRPHAHARRGTLFLLLLLLLFCLLLIATLFGLGHHG